MQTRRSFLRAGAAAGLSAFPLTAVAARAAANPLLRGTAFDQGVMAGVPAADGITLWTHAGAGNRGRLRWEVALDDAFRRVVAHGATTTGEGGDARARVDGLPAGEQLFYRWASADTDSPVGRFRTARPADSRTPVRIGFFSCQLFTQGFYTAHAALAQEDLDLVVCLGDYMYETAGSGVRQDPIETEELGEYRAKYALYRTDPDLRAMHAAHAFVATWDDHEVDNNYAGDAPGTDGSPRIPFEDRRANAYRAWFEAMPVLRFPEDPDRIFRSVPLGGAAELLLLDTRQHRDDQACDDRPAVPCGEADEPGRTLLGGAQKRWLKERLRGSGATWKVLGSSVQMAGWQVAPTLPLNPDGWDGYAAERRELLELCLAEGIEDVTVITGDVHNFCAADVHTGGDVRTPAAATEFIGGSVTSVFNDDGFLGDVFEATNPHFRFQDFDRRGYGVIELGPDGLRCDFRSPLTTQERTSPVETLASFVVERGTPRVEQV
jgi:alkaline phosphatase D